MLKNFYDEQRVVQRTPVIEQKSIYGLDPLRDIWSGDVTSNGNEFILTGAADGGTIARLDTAERGPYPPGQQLEPGLAFREITKPVGGQGARWGYFDDSNGWFFLLNAGGLYVVTRRAGVDNEVLWGKWDGERIKDSRFARRLSFDLRDGYVYQIPLTWYGFGPAQFNFQLAEQFESGWVKTLTQSRPRGQTSVTNPHLPVRCEVFTGAGDPAYEARVSGRQVSVVGPYDTISRETSVENALTSVDDTAWMPIMSVRRSSVEPYALTRLEALEPLSTGAVRIAIVEGVVPPNSGNWEPITDYQPGSTLLEQNLAPGATLDLQDGNLLRKVRNQGGSSRNDIGGDPRNLVRTPLIEDRTHTIFVRMVDGENASDVSLTAVFREFF